MNKTKKQSFFFQDAIFFCPLASFLSFTEPFLLLHPRGFVTSSPPVQFSFSAPWLPPLSVALWVSSLHNTPSFSSIFCHPVQLMLLLMTWNEFSCLNCEGPQGKGWRWERWSHLAGHRNRNGKQLEAEHVLTSHFIRHIFLWGGGGGGDLWPGGQSLEGSWRAGLQLGEMNGVVIVVSQSMDAAAASSFALVSVFTGRFQSLLAGARRAKWSLCWFWARNRSLCLFFFFGSLDRCFPELPA